MTTIQQQQQPPGRFVSLAIAAVPVIAASVIGSLATLLQAVLSWVNPGSPVAPLLDAMTRPFLRMFRRRIPPIGNVDLSPLFLIVVIQLQIGRAHV